jgi:hypothetical protein
MASITRTVRQRLLWAIIVLSLTLGAVSAARADEPGLHQAWVQWDVDSAAESVETSPGSVHASGWYNHAAQGPDVRIAQIQGTRTCNEVPPSEIGEVANLAFTDADLLPGSDGTRLCIYFDASWDSYGAWTLNAGSVEEFRRIKAQFQPLLSQVGIEACRVAFWSALNGDVSRQLNRRDRFDAGKPCTPEVISHGLESQFRQAEIEASINAAAAKAEEVFGWKLSWPIRIHAYDTEEDFAFGLTREGGFTPVSARAVVGISGVTSVIASGGMGYLLNLRRFADATDLRMLIAHEFTHIAQGGLLGDRGMLPFFVAEGGAEYFASLVVGPDQKNLADRFQAAVGDERSNHAVPLSGLVKQPEPDDTARISAAYSRGYAAMRFLASRWGQESFGRLHRENVGGSPERFLEAMQRLTGLTLDEFDGQLRTYLLSQATTAATVGRATLVPGSLLISLETGRLTSDNRLEPAERFGRSDKAVYVFFQFACLERAVRGEVRILMPSRDRFATFGGASGPGCDEGAYVMLPLDAIVNSRSARTQPGTWTVEVYADGMLQGSITFVLE